MVPFIELRDSREAVSLENEEFLCKVISFLGKSAHSWREWQRLLDASYSPSILPFLNHRKPILFGVAESLAMFPLQLRTANEQVFQAL